MKQAGGHFLLSFFSATLLLLWMVVAHAEDTATIVRTAPLKQNPSFNSKTLRELPPGAQVRLGKLNGGWRQVSLLPEAKVAGWVRGYQVRDDIETGQTTVVQNKTTGGVLSGLSNLSRRTSGLFGRREMEKNDNLTATIGVRGLSEEDLNNAKPDPQELSKLEQYAVKSSSAKQFAVAGGLKTRNIKSLPAPKK